MVTSTSMFTYDGGRLGLIESDRDPHDATILKCPGVEVVQPVLAHEPANPGHLAGDFPRQDRHLDTIPDSDLG